MKVSNMIERLQEIKERFGDLEVQVGEASGIFRTMVDVNASMMEDEEMVCVVQAYVVRR